MRCALFLILFLLLVLNCRAKFVLANEGPQLTVEDCQKCHMSEYEKVAQGGRAHRQMVDCLDCHANHRPLNRNNIPECKDCHAGRPHAALLDCTACHAPVDKCDSCHDVHQPLAETDGQTALSHCQFCHASATEQLQASSSRHNQLSCTLCHPVHRKVQACSECHGLPHSLGIHQRFTACSTCHNTAHNLNESI